MPHSAGSKLSPFIYHCDKHRVQLDGFFPNFTSRPQTEFVPSSSLVPCLPFVPRIPSPPSRALFAMEMPPRSQRDPQMYARTCTENCTVVPHYDRFGRQIRSDPNDGVTPVGPTRTQFGESCALALLFHFRNHRSRWPHPHQIPNPPTVMTDRVLIFFFFSFCNSKARDYQYTESPESHHRNFFPLL